MFGSFFRAFSSRRLGMMGGFLLASNTSSRVLLTIEENERINQKLKKKLN
jgi:hypothetical protein